MDETITGVNKRVFISWIIELCFLIRKFVHQRGQNGPPRAVWASHAQFSCSTILAGRSWTLLCFCFACFTRFLEIGGRRSGDCWVIYHVTRGSFMISSSLSFLFLFFSLVVFDSMHSASRRSGHCHKTENSEATGRRWRVFTIRRWHFYARARLLLASEQEYYWVPVGHWLQWLVIN